MRATRDSDDSGSSENDAEEANGDDDDEDYIVGSERRSAQSGDRPRPVKRQGSFGALSPMTAVRGSQGLFNRVVYVVDPVDVFFSLVLL
jgi:hypothetical protein